MLGYEDYVFHSCHLYRWLPLLVTPGPQLQSPPKSKDLRRCPDQGLPMWSKCQRLPQDLVSGSELWYMPPLSKEVLLVQMAGDAWLDGTSLVALEYTPLHDNRHCVCYVLSLNLCGLRICRSHIVCWSWSLLCSLNSEAAPLGGDVLVEEKELPNPSTSEWQDHKPQFHVWHQWKCISVYWLKDSHADPSISTYTMNTPFIYLYIIIWNKFLQCRICTSCTLLLLMIYIVIFNNVCDWI